jgi:hypothetical protein
MVILPGEQGRGAGAVYDVQRRPEGRGLRAGGAAVLTSEQWERWCSPASSGSDALGKEMSFHFFFSIFY